MFNFLALSHFMLLSQNSELESLTLKVGYKLFGLALNCHQVNYYHKFVNVVTQLFVEPTDFSHFYF